MMIIIELAHCKTQNDRLGPQECIVKIRIGWVMTWLQALILGTIFKQEEVIQNKSRVKYSWKGGLLPAQSVTVRIDSSRVALKITQKRQLIECLASNFLRNTGRKEYAVFSCYYNDCSSCLSALGKNSRCWEFSLNKPSIIWDPNPFKTYFLCASSQGA